MEKTLTNTTSSQAKENVNDLEIWGDGDTFKLICKASSQKEGWMKSTKAMEIKGVGCVVQVTTQQRNETSIQAIKTFAKNSNGFKVWDWEDREANQYTIAESISFVPRVKIEEIKEGEEIVGRKLVTI